MNSAGKSQQQPPLAAAEICRRCGHLLDGRCTGRRGPQDAAGGADGQRAACASFEGIKTIRGDSELFGEAGEPECEAVASSPYKESKKRGPGGGEVGAFTLPGGYEPSIGRRPGQASTGPHVFDLKGQAGPKKQAGRGSERHPCGLRLSIAGRIRVAVAEGLRPDPGSDPAGGAITTVAANPCQWAGLCGPQWAARGPAVGAGGRCGCCT